MNRNVMESQISEALGLRHTIELEAGPALSSCFAVTDLAAASIAAVGYAINDLLQSTLNTQPDLPTVDRRLASMWFVQSIYPNGWQLPPVWDAIAGNYECADGWIRLHTNLSHHRDSALKVLGTDADKKQVAQEVSRWQKNQLESEIVGNGGAAAAMKSIAEWNQHPQGIAITQQPLVIWQHRKSKSVTWKGSHIAPLDRLKVLDMTRVLAGPVATRTLAGFGANVLRIDPPDWQEDNVVPDIMLGKRSTFLDLAHANQMASLVRLIEEADVFIHGYRPGALDKLGLTSEFRRTINPDLIEVSLNAYGWEGPWAGRRGFDSLVQMSTGIADAGRCWASSETPTPLPVQALDHATGYLMAAACIKAIELSISQGESSCVQLSLARTAELLKTFRQNKNDVMDINFTHNDADPIAEITPWGNAYRLKSPLSMAHTPLSWARPACEFGAFPAKW